MVIVRPGEALALLEAEADGIRRLVALRHALRERQPLRGDRARDPRCLFLRREGLVLGRVALFGAGDWQPALRWLMHIEEPVVLLGPASWRAPLLTTLAHRMVEPATLCVRYRPESAPFPPARPELSVVRLGERDHARFTASVPPWAWQSWGSAHACLVRGAVFALPYGDDLAATAWVLEEDNATAAIGVFTAPRYRELGLGRAVAAALSRHVVVERRRCPLWATTPENQASLALAQALGYTLAHDEPLLMWAGR
jgi:RimJ/RimL family protein N-acetyltransferase